MKRNVLVISAAILLAGACAPQAAPTMNPADIQATAQAAAFTMVAQTQQALPTNTPIPPTETASPAPSPTEAAPALPTQETPLPGVLLPGALPTFTPQSPSGSGSNQDPCNQPLTSWQGKTAHFTISNQTKPKGTIILSMYVETDMGQCGYLIITGDSFSGPAGQYSAGAFITGKKNMKSFGSFRIPGGNWKIVVGNDNITAAGSCYPDC
ncbi:MAG: hypothetical protein JW730_10885 [Anaerolineales bacterium]|nr:hypothetical protein [Anaerolineales bacterium]